MGLHFPKQRGTISSKPHLSDLVSTDATQHSADHLHTETTRHFCVSYKIVPFVFVLAPRATDPPRQSSDRGHEQARKGKSPAGRKPDRAADL